MNQKIIDVHAHIYPEKIARKAVKAIGYFYRLDMAAKDGTLNEIKTLAKKSNVVKIVVHSVATNKNQVRSINDFVSKATNNDNLFIPFATLHPDMEKQELREEIARFDSLNIKGVKLHPDFQEFEIDGKKSYKILEMIDSKYAIQMHTGDKRKSFSHPSQMVKAAKDFPHLRFIAAHLGGWSEWEHYKLYKGLNNVWFDCCSSLAFMPADKAKTIIEFLGYDKVMFGTDFPMWDYDGELALLEKLNLSSNVLQKILFENANNFFNLNL
ncbi:MAG: amidohydrolase family protein [Clostridiales bacterium]|nr:amidohydrolase family protein [Clostridiales bacterium]